MAYTISEPGAGGVVVFNTLSPGQLWQFNGTLNPQGHIVSGFPPRSPAMTGTGAAASTLIGPTFVGNDTAMQVTLGIGPSPIVGNLAQIFFGTPYLATPIIQITEASASTAATDSFVVASTNSFIIGCAVAPPISGTVAWNVFVLG